MATNSDHKKKKEKKENFSSSTKNEIEEEEKRERILYNHGEVARGTDMGHVLNIISLKKDIPCRVI